MSFQPTINALFQPILNFFRAGLNKSVEWSGYLVKSLHTNLIKINESLPKNVLIILGINALFFATIRKFGDRAEAKLVNALKTKKINPLILRESGIGALGAGLNFTASKLTQGQAIKSMIVTVTMAIIALDLFYIRSRVFIKKEPANIAAGPSISSKTPNTIDDKKSRKKSSSQSPSPIATNQRNSLKDEYELKLSEEREKLSSKQHELDALNTKFVRSQQQNNEKEQEILKLKKANTQNEDDLKSSLADIDRLNGEIKTLNVKEKKQELKIAQFEKDTTEAKQDIQKLSDLISRLKSEQKILETAKNEFEKQNKLFDGVVKKITKELEDEKKSHKTSLDSLNTLSNKLKLIIDENSKLEKEVERIEKLYKKAQQQNLNDIALIKVLREDLEKLKQKEKKSELANLLGTPQTPEKKSDTPQVTPARMPKNSRTGHIAASSNQPKKEEEKFAVPQSTHKVEEKASQTIEKSRKRTPSDTSGILEIYKQYESPERLEAEVFKNTPQVDTPERAKAMDRFGSSVRGKVNYTRKKLSQPIKMSPLDGSPW